MNNLRRATVAWLLASFQVGCYRPYPPTKPDGVPAEAVWAGGLDGGGWVLCSTPSPSYNECTIYDEEGRTHGPRRYVLGQTGLAAKPNQLRYTYLTGEAIGLEGNIELKRINEK
jgi:hypothetical protein